MDRPDPIRWVRLLPPAALLTACGSSQPPTDPRIAVLEQRLTEQTARIDALEAARTRAVVDGDKPAAPGVVPATAYVLVGGGSLSDAGRRYASQEECDAAKQAVLDSAPALGREAKAKGAVFVPPLGMSCLPTLLDGPPVAE